MIVDPFEMLDDGEDYDRDTPEGLPTLGERAALNELKAKAFDEIVIVATSMLAEEKSGKEYSSAQNDSRLASDVVLIVNNFLNNKVK